MIWNVDLHRAFFRANTKVRKLYSVYTRPAEPFLWHVQIQQDVAALQATGNSVYRMKKEYMRIKFYAELYIFLYSMCSKKCTDNKNNL